MHVSPDVLALLALGEPAATAADRRHLATCPLCSEEVAELTRLTTVGRSTTATDTIVHPSPLVWERIRSELGFSTPSSVLTEDFRPQVVPAPGVSASSRGFSSPPVTSAVAASVTDISARHEDVRESPPRRNRSRRYLGLALAAALALIVGIGIGIGYERQVIQPENRVIAQATLNALPQFSGATGTAEVTADGRGGRQLILHMSSPKPITGSVQVWLMDGKLTEATWMGTMTGDAVTIDIPRGMSLLESPVVDISDEPAGDTDHVHDGQSILRGSLT